ncbi:MAG: hypothetical protein ACLQGP_24405 [Isosphaeraceae bacterium]
MLVRELAEARCRLAEITRSAPPSAAKSAEPSKKPIGAMLGPETTGLQVDTAIKLRPVPTGIYNLLDPGIDPLLTVTITNLTNDPRRLRVTAFIEGLSAREIKTFEFKRSEVKQPRTVNLRPTLLPVQARRITEIQCATLHVKVDIFGSTMNSQTRQDTWSNLVESHDTHSIILLSRNSGFNAVEDPETGTRRDLTRYYGAWVTPNAESVQAFVRRAADRVPDRRIAGYQGRPNPETTAAQVRALFETLKEANIRYVESVIDFGAAPGQFTQRTRLPRESLRHKSANCVDGTVLMASLLEAASLQPAIVLVPGHAFVAWETWEGSDEWDYLETTMISSHDFEAARLRARSLYERYAAEDLPTDDGPLLRVLKLSELRAQGIWPME